jgi:NADH-quinone oxidoreductase subunit N
VTVEAVGWLLPEMILVGVATLAVMLGAFAPRWGGASWLGAGGILAAAVALLMLDPVGKQLGPLAADALSHYLRWLVLSVGLGFVLMSERAAARSQGSEFVASLLLALAGLSLAASAQDLVLMFLGLELVSIPTYVLLYLSRRDAAAQESTAKYFFLSVLSSAITLYGFSFLYGAAGSTSLVALRAALLTSAGGPAALAPVGLVLTFAGLGFKIAAVPFHFYAPDVFQGASHTGAGLLSILPKAAGFLALARIVVFAMPGLELYGLRLALILAVVTMTLGNVVALWQVHLRRLFAYSSIAHAGYMLIGLATSLAGERIEGAPPGFDGLGATFFYLALYALATTGVFAAFNYLSSDERPLDHLDDLAGVARSHPLAAGAIALFMFSLAGIPPLAGFWGKLSLFAGALGVQREGGGEGGMGYWFVGLAIVGALNAAIAAAYYLKIVAIMFFRPALSEDSAEEATGPGVVMMACAVLVVVVGLIPGPLMARSEQASLAGRRSAGRVIEPTVQHADTALPLAAAGR